MPLVPIAAQIQPRQRRDPLDQAMKAMQLRSAIGLEQYRSVEAQKMQQSMADDKAARDVFASTTDPQERLMKLGAVNPKLFMDYSEWLQKQSDDVVNQQQKKLEIEDKRHTILASGIQSIIDNVPEDQQPLAKQQFVRGLKKNGIFKEDELGEDWGGKSAEQQDVYMSSSFPAAMKQLTDQFALQRKQQNLDTYGTEAPTEEERQEFKFATDFLGQDPRKADAKKRLEARDAYYKSKQPDKSLDYKIATFKDGSSGAVILNPDPDHKGIFRMNPSTREWDDVSDKVAGFSAGSVDQAELEDYLRKNPGKGAFDFAQAKAGLSKNEATFNTAIPQDLRNAATRSMMGGVVARKADTIELMNNLWKQGDTDQIKQVVRQATLESDRVSPDELRQYTARENSLKQINVIEDMLRDYKGKGGDTNIIKGTVEQIAEKLGFTIDHDVVQGQGNDPKLAEIQTRILQSLVDFRRGVTGVQFSAQEAQQYEKIFPNMSNTLDLNLSRIKQFREAATLNNNTFWERRLGEKNAKLVDAWLDPTTGRPTGSSLSGGGTGGRGIVYQGKQLPPGYIVAKDKSTGATVAVRESTFDASKYDKVQ